MQRLFFLKNENNDKHLQAIVGVSKICLSEMFLTLWPQPFDAGLL